jgi:hypothetical protein
MGAATDPAGINMRPKLGLDVYFIGLLASIPNMGIEGKPVVRRGSVAALDQENVTWTTPPFGPTWGGTVHLIDSLSFGGFSGSPCFVQANYPVDRRPGVPQDFWDRWHQDGITRQQVGDTLLIGGLWGMFVAHTNKANIGIVIPIEAVRDLLQSEEIETMRAEGRKRDAQRDDAEGFKSQASSGSGFTRNDFPVDLRQVTRLTRES